MNIYSRKQHWKLLLLIAAAIIVGLSLWFSGRLVRKISTSEKRNVELWAEAVRRKAMLVDVTNTLYSKIAREERKKVELWAEANRQLSKDLTDYSFAFEVIKGNETVPVMLLDDRGRMVYTRNLDSTRTRDSLYLREQLQIMREQHDSIPIDVGTGRFQYLFYKDSEVFTEIRQSFENNERSFIKEVAANPASAPAIYTDSTSTIILAFGNLDTTLLRQDSIGYLKQALAELRAEGDTITVSLGNHKKNLIYYMESPQLKQLRYFPVVQIVVVGMFLLIAYLLFSTSRKAEQDHVWVGMAKETAHQLGTPLSSLIAWQELLKLKGVDPEMTDEIGKDLKRLEMITERFSKIGSQPKMESENLVDALQQAVDYISSRSPKTVSFTLHASGQIQVPLNVPLFAWVVENLCRNAVDAMGGQGAITIDILDQTQFVYLDITDTGKGMPKSKYKTIFEPGFTTKKRGWGLGLSLCKRIIEQYHKGKIFVKRSELGKGTTFRIVLNK